MVLHTKSEAVAPSFLLHSCSGYFRKLTRKISLVESFFKYSFSTQSQKFPVKEFS